MVRAEREASRSYVPGASRAPPPMEMRVEEAAAAGRLPGRAPADERAEAAPPPTWAEPQLAAITESSAASRLVYCDALEEMVPAIVCQRATAVNQGVAGVKAKPKMVLGEVQTVRLVVSRRGDQEAVEDELGGRDAVFREFRLATGRYMEARLTADSGLEITPSEWVRKDLGAGDLEDWEWQVKAMAAGRHMVTLRTRVMKQEADGRFIPRPGRESEPQYVDVEITRGQEIEQRIGLFARWLQALSAPLESMNNLLTLLTSLVAAAGGLWLALRNFGKGKKAGDGDR